MANDINSDLGSLKIFQLGYVYRDVEKQAKVMESSYGVSNFIVFDPVDVDVNYRGVDKVIKMRAAFGRIFDTEIELLQPVEGESIYTEFLNQGREGLHHICYKVDDIQAILKKYKEKGVEVIQSGKLITLLYAYMDTEKDLGIIVEYTEEKKRRKRKNRS